MCSPLKGFLLIVPLKSNQRQTKISIMILCSWTLRSDAHCGAWLRDGMQSIAHRGAFWEIFITWLFEYVRFHVIVFVMSFDSIFLKHFWSKKDSLNNSSQRNSICKTLDQNKHFVSYWLCSVMHTAESDSAVWCTTQSLIPRWDAHHRV